MKIQCKDGILDTGTAEFSQYNAERMHLQFVAIGREAVRAGKPQYQTPCTVENARAVLEAQLRKEQRIASEAAEKRAAWLSELTNEALVEMNQRAWAADMSIPQDVEQEMERRGLLPETKVTLGSPEFMQYVEARARAERGGRLDDFEDGIS